MPFLPIAVADFDLEDGSVDGMATLSVHQPILIVVRHRGCPVGTVELPARDRGWTRDAIVGRIDDRLADRLVRRHVARRMLAAPHDASTPLSLTVAVCTRDRPADLASCLESLAALEGPVDVVIVDNAPSGDGAAQVAARFPSFRYVVEPRPGLSRARRRAVAATASDILAFVDDDVTVDRWWGLRLRAPFAADAAVDAVLGLVVPLELAFEAQLRFERHGGFGRGFDRRWFRMDRRAAAHTANTGTMGTGANMAFRRAVFDRVGGFDTALGAGTPSGGGEDLEMLFRVLASGGTIVYEPGALVHHRHRRDLPGLHAQIESWGRGMFAHLAASWTAWPAHRRAMATLGLQLLALYYPRRVVQGLFDPDLDAGLAWAELRGAWSGPSRYRQGRAPAADPPALEARASTMPTRLAAATTTVATIDLSRPVSADFVCPGGRLDLQVVDGARQVGELSIGAGGGRVSALEAIDAVVAHFDTHLLDPSGAARAGVGRMFQTVLDRARDAG